METLDEGAKTEELRWKNVNGKGVMEELWKIFCRRALMKKIRNDNQVKQDKIVKCSR